MEAQPSSKPYLHRKPLNGKAITLPIIDPAAGNICYFTVSTAIMTTFIHQQIAVKHNFTANRIMC